LLSNSFYRLIDPVRELQRIAAVAGKNTQLLVGQQVVEFTPGLLAMAVSMELKHVFSWKGVETTLKAAGFSLQKRYLAYTPYYTAIWER